MQRIVAIPLRSAQASRDWALDCRNLSRTILSAIAQATVIVIGHERPPELHGATFVEAGFPPPKDASEYMHDKGMKKKCAAAYARTIAEAEALFMYCDADDILHPRLFDMAEAEGRSDWLFGAGYIYDQRRDVLARVDSPPFHQICGTCLVSRVRPDDLPCPPNYGCYTDRLDDHTQFGEIARRHGREPVSDGPPVVIYVVNHGGNYTAPGTWLADLCDRNALSGEEIRNVVAEFNFMRRA
jgi:hypothetical protein